MISFERDESFLVSAFRQTGGKVMELCGLARKSDLAKSWHLPSVRKGGAGWRAAGVWRTPAGTVYGGSERVDETVPLLGPSAAVEHFLVQPGADAADGADVLAENVGCLGGGEAELDEQAHAAFGVGHLAESGQAAEEVLVHRADVPFHFVPFFRPQGLAGQDASVQFIEIVGAEELFFRLPGGFRHELRSGGLLFLDLCQLPFGLLFAAAQAVCIGEDKQHAGCQSRQNVHQPAVRGLQFALCGGQHEAHHLGVDVGVVVVIDGVAYFPDACGRHSVIAYIGVLPSVSLHDHRGVVHHFQRIASSVFHVDEVVLPLVDKLESALVGRDDDGAGEGGPQLAFVKGAVAAEDAAIGHAVVRKVCLCSYG